MTPACGTVGHARQAASQTGRTLLSGLTWQLRLSPVCAFPHTHTHVCTRTRSSACLAHSVLHLIITTATLLLRLLPPPLLQPDDESEAGGDSVSASEARKRLERFRTKAKVDAQAAKDGGVGKVRCGARRRALRCSSGVSVARPPARPGRGQRVCRGRGVRAVCRSLVTFARSRAGLCGGGGGGGGCGGWGRGARQGRAGPP